MPQKLNIAGICRALSKIILAVRLWHHCVNYDELTQSWIFLTRIGALFFVPSRNVLPAWSWHLPEPAPTR